MPRARTPLTLLFGMFIACGPAFAVDPELGPVDRDLNLESSASEITECAKEIATLSEPTADETRLTEGVKKLESNLVEMKKIIADVTAEFESLGCDPKKGVWNDQCNSKARVLAEAQRTAVATAETLLKLQADLADRTAKRKKELQEKVAELNRLCPKAGSSTATAPAAPPPGPVTIDAHYEKGSIGLERVGAPIVDKNPGGDWAEVTSERIRLEQRGGTAFSGKYGAIFTWEPSSLGPISAYGTILTLKVEAFAQQGERIFTGMGVEGKGGVRFQSTCPPGGDPNCKPENVAAPRLEAYVDPSEGKGGTVSTSLPVRIFPPSEIQAGTEVEIRIGAFYGPGVTYKYRAVQH